MTPLGWLGRKTSTQTNKQTNSTIFSWVCTFLVLHSIGDFHTVYLEMMKIQILFRNKKKFLHLRGISTDLTIFLYQQQFSIFHNDIFRKNMKLCNHMEVHFFTYISFELWQTQICLWDMCWQWKLRLDSIDAQSDQGLSCPLPESLDTVECCTGEQRSGWNFAHAQDDVNPHSFCSFTRCPDINP